MNERLKELQAMRARIDHEIQREEAFMLRMARLRDTVHEVLAKHSPTVRGTLIAVAAEYDLSVADLMSRQRYTAVAAARHVAAAVLRRQGLSYPEVGRVMNRDHGTVIHSCQRVAASPDLTAAVERVEARLADDYASTMTDREVS